MGKLEVGEVFADAAAGEDEGNVVAEDAEDNEAGFVEEAMDLIGRASDAEDEVELVGGDKAIEHRQGLHMEHSGMELGDKAFEPLVLVMTGKDIHLAIHGAGSRGVEELAGCTDSSADEEPEDTKVGWTGLKHVQHVVRD